MFRNGTGAGRSIKQTPVAQRDTQELSVQQTSKQEKDDSNRHSRFEKNVSPVGTREEARPPYSAYLASVIADFSSEFGDAEHSLSNVTQALRLWQRSGTSEEEFVQLMYQAKTQTRSYQGKNGSRGIENKMAYFFAVLSRVLSTE